MAKKKEAPPRNTAVFVLLALLILAGAWYLLQTKQQPAIPPANITPVPTEPGVEKEDLVAINFVLTLPNGSVVDTNNETLARQYNVTRYVKGPYRFVVSESGKVKGFDEAILGMKLGEKRTRVIAPSEQVLTYVLNRTRSISRNQPIARFQPIPKKAFENIFKRKPVINDVVSNPGFAWPFKVINLTERHVITEPLVEEGKSYQLPGMEWKSTLLVKTYDDLLFRHNPQEGQIITTDLGKAVVMPGIGRINITYQAAIGDIVTHSIPLQGGTAAQLPSPFRVTEAGNTTFTITRINYLPQETLVLTAELLEWESEVSKPKQVPAQEN